LREGLEEGMKGGAAEERLEVEEESEEEDELMFVWSGIEEEELVEEDGESLRESYGFGVEKSVMVRGAVRDGLLEIAEVENLLVEEEMPLNLFD